MKNLVILLVFAIIAFSVPNSADAGMMHQQILQDQRRSNVTAAAFAGIPQELFRKAERLGGHGKQSWEASSEGFASKQWQENGRIYYLLITWDRIIKECSWKDSMFSTEGRICHMLDD